MWYYFRKHLIAAKKAGENLARRILITSGKGGVGKTSVTAYLGLYLSKMGRRVVCVDMDIGLNNLDAVMCVENKIVFDLKDVIDGKCRVKQSIIEISPTLSVIASKYSSGSDLSGRSVRDLTEGLKSHFDYILIDSPAGIDAGFHRAATAADEVLLVVTPTLTSLRDGDKVLGILNNYDLKTIGVVVNRARGDLILSGASVDPAEIKAVLKCPVAGCIPEDDSVYLSGADGTLNLFKSRAESGFRLLSKFVDKGSGKVYDVTRYYKGISGAIRRNLRQNI